MSLTLNNPQKFAKPAEISKEKLDKAIKALIKENLKK